MVDDDSVSNLILSEALKKASHQVALATQGAEGWALLQQAKFDVVIADWIMPEIDGLELCRRIREQESVSYTYVILLTGRNQTEDRIRGLRAGADDFLTKPYDAGELIARLEVAERILSMQLELREAQRIVEEARKSEIDLGAHIQRTLLMARAPEEPTSFEFAALNLPSLAIDGDFFDFLVHESCVVDLFVGDAMGKGVPAALISAGAKSQVLRAIGMLARRFRDRLPAPVEVVNLAHASLAQEFISIGAFVTFMYLRLDARTKEARWVNCGHTPLIHWSAKSEEVTVHKDSDCPIGFLAEARYQEWVHELEEGDLLCVFSDGVTEAHSPAGEQFGIARLQGLIRRTPRALPRELLDKIKEAVLTHSQSARCEDDLTCIIIRVAPDRVGALETISLSPRLSELQNLRNFLSQAGGKCGLSRPRLNELVLAAHEVMTNIIRHAEVTGLEPKIEVQTNPIINGITVSLKYQGRSFSPPEKIELPLLPASEGGYGLYIIERSVDSVQYHHEPPNQNEIVLVKYR